MSFYVNSRVVNACPPTLVSKHSLSSRNSYLQGEMGNDSNASIMSSSAVDSGKWKEHQSDRDLRREIHKDVVRTRPDLQFFLDGNGSRRDAMKRILFVYAKLNPGVRYVQGMNEVLGTMFYVFASDGNEAWSKHAESDTFFCFTNLLAEIRDVYIRSLDDCDSGLYGKIGRLNDLLKLHDPELWSHLNAHQLNPSFYSLRWITTLLTREFSLTQTLVLWDSLFAETSRSDFLCYFCLAMLREKRNDLLKGDFCCCLNLLQNYPTSDLRSLLDETIRLQQKHPELQLAHDQIVQDRGRLLHGYMPNWLARSQ